MYSQVQRSQCQNEWRSTCAVDSTPKSCCCRRPHSWAWQRGMRLASRQMSVQVFFSSPFSSKFAAYGHYHATNFASPSECSILFQHAQTHICMHTHAWAHAHAGKPCSNLFSVQKGEEELRADLNDAMEKKSVRESRVLCSVAWCAHFVSWRHPVH